MENISSPNPIKEYYIAYFDILGYRQFFKDCPEMVESLLNEIHNAIINIKKTLSVPKNVDFFNLTGVNFDFKVKVFSDNVIICLEIDGNNNFPYTNVNCSEKLKALIFLDFISTIQRGFIINYKLFVRGSVTIGKISFNDDYVFGEGLIEAVDIEEHTVYPRIEISNSLFNFVENVISYSVEEIDKTIEIEKNIKNNIEVSQEDKSFYERTLQIYQYESFIHMIFKNMLYMYGDGKISLSYLYELDPNEYFSSDYISAQYNSLKQNFPNVYNEFNLMRNTYLSKNDKLKIHRGCIVEKINAYGNYNDIELNNSADAIQRERILKKYAWAMKYHNDMCVIYNKREYYIDSIANCDVRFMLLMINVVEPSQSMNFQIPIEPTDVNKNEQQEQKLE